MGEQVELGAYFLISEALTNVCKHASATTAIVELDHDGDTLHIVVRDDGVGFATAGIGSGLRGLQERVEALGGTMTVTSRPGGGTTVRAQLPGPAAVRV
jgi:signal transduction histidine kinase